LVSRQYYRLRNYLSQAHIEDYTYHYKSEAQRKVLEGTISRDKHPPEGKRLESINKRILAQKKYKRRWEKLLSKFEAVSQSGTPLLEPLQAELSTLADLYVDPDGDYGDDRGTELFIEHYENIFSLLDEQTIRDFITADAEMLEALDPLKQSIAEIKKLKQQQKVEAKRLNWWNQIILADLWLIRPDERPET